MNNREAVCKYAIFISSLSNAQERFYWEPVWEVAVVARVADDGSSSSVL